MSTEEIRSWQAGLLADGLSAATVRQTARLLRSILGQAVDDGRLARNAATKVKQPSVRPRRQLFLTAAELGNLPTSVVNTDLWSGSSDGPGCALVRQWRSGRGGSTRSDAG